MSITKGDCPFCGAVQVAIDDEHVFAQRIIRLLLRLRQPRAKFTVRRSRGRNQKEYVTTYPELIVHGPCKDVCNNGWMRELEERTADYLDPMIAAGQVTFLDATKVPTLSLWAVVRTMVYEFHDVPPAPQYFTDADRLVARRGGFPTTHHFDVWTARYSGGLPFVVSPMPINVKTSTGFVPAHYATFTAGQFVFQVLARPRFLSTREPPRTPGPWHRLLKIFPKQSSETLVWPPAEELNDNELKLFNWSFLTGDITPRRSATKLINGSL